MATEEALIDTQEGLLSYAQGGIHIPGLQVRRLSNGGMEMAVVVKGTRSGGTLEEELRTDASAAGSLLVANGHAPYSVLAATRSVFSGNTFAGTAKAPVAAPPTTSPEWMLWNGEAAGGKSYVMLEASCVSISGTLGLGLAIMGGVGTIAETVNPTAYASSVIAGTAGSVGTSNARIVNNPTILSTPAYHTLATRDQVSAVSVGSGLTADLAGKYIVPPGFGFAFEVVAPAGTNALFAVSFVWAQLQLTLTG